MCCFLVVGPARPRWGPRYCFRLKAARRASANDLGYIGRQPVWGAESRRGGGFARHAGRPNRLYCQVDAPRPNLITERPGTSRPGAVTAALRRAVSRTSSHCLARARSARRRSCSSQSALRSSCVGSVRGPLVGGRKSGGGLSGMPDPRCGRSASYIAPGCLRCASHRRRDGPQAPVAARRVLSHQGAELRFP
jgi:hypothetical protein